MSISISPVSATSGLSQTDSQSSINQLRQSFRQLASSLQSGDLAGAQKAFSTIETLLSSSSPSQNSNGQSASTPTSPVQNDLAALGQALSSGNLTTAQSDFSKLLADLQPARQSAAAGSGQSVGSAHRHGHHQAEASGPDSSSTATDPAAPTGVVSGPNSAGGKISLYV